MRRSLEKLGMEYVDLYLIHWPMNGIGAIKKPMHEIWRDMESLVKKGLTKSIGLSNYNIQMIADILTYAEIKPSVN
jgi:diketogulonate reductase-like aldo/keto reductase